MGRPAAAKVFGVVLDILQIVFALVVIVLTSWRLFNVNVEGLQIDTNCLLDGSGKTDALSGSKFCIFAIAVGVVSFLVNAIFGCMRNICKCITANACGASRIISVIGDTALGVWWTVAFVLFVRRGTAANDLGWPERSARDGVIAASFGAAAVFYADVIFTVCGMVAQR